MILRQNIIVALGIRHIKPSDMTHELITTSGSIAALRLMKGQCFHRASILTAILRSNGIPARIVGNAKFEYAENGL
ncbi:MAG: transglutaminase-like domain-containing protein [Candidatus Micrarchaeota archaeon]